VQRVAERSNIEQYTPNKPGQISDWMQKNSGTVGGSGKKNVIPKEDAKFIEDNIKTQWGDTDMVVMKRARSGQAGGNHFTDMYAGRNPFARPKGGNGVAQNSVKAMEKYGDDWIKHFPEQGVNYKVLKRTDDAVWVQSRGRNVGTAVTEGGVSWMAKIDKDGTIMSVISDKHDFLEKPLQAVAGAANKIPGVNMHPEMLDKSLVTVSPPMYTNVKNLTKSKKLAPVTKNIEGIAPPKAPKGESMVSLLEEIAAVKPSEMGVKAEQLKQAGMLSGAAAVIGGNE